MNGIKETLRFSLITTPFRWSITLILSIPFIVSHSTPFKILARFFPNLSPNLYPKLDHQRLIVRTSWMPKLRIQVISMKTFLLLKWRIVYLTGFIPWLCTDCSNQKRHTPFLYVKLLNKRDYIIWSKNTWNNFTGLAPWNLPQIEATYWQWSKSISSFFHRVFTLSM